MKSANDYTSTTVMYNARQVFLQYYFSNGKIGRLVIKYFLVLTMLLVFLPACGQNAIMDKIVVVNIHDYDSAGIVGQIQNVLK